MRTPEPRWTLLSGDEGDGSAGRKAREADRGVHEDCTGAVRMTELATPEVGHGDSPGGGNYVPASSFFKKTATSFIKKTHASLRHRGQDIGR